MRKSIVPVVAAVVAAVSLSACGTTAPQIKTVTKTVRPDPIIKTKTVTKTVTKTPQSCLDALDAAEKATHLASEFARASSDYPAMVRDAFKAGLQGNPYEAQDVLNRMKSATRKYGSINRRLTPTVVKYNNAASDCRSH